MRRLLLVIAALAVPGVGWCEGYKSKAVCSDATGNDQLASTLCKYNSMPPDKIHLDFSAEWNASRFPVISGNTNLPPGMKFIVSIFYIPTGELLGQDDISIQKNGHFSTQAFSMSGAPYPWGGYEVEIASPLPPLQPDSVQKIIGTHGENMEGKFVVPSPLMADETIIKVRFGFIIHNDAMQFPSTYRPGYPYPYPTFGASMPSQY